VSSNFFIVASMHIIGIVGTAKNTGKTTTLAALIAEAGRRHVRIGVTGIGYDGEEIDTITGLPKPRLLLQSGTIAATSEQCLLTTSADYAVIKKTNTHTALGAVVIVEILRPGLMVLAGPNTKRLLRDLIAELEPLGLASLFVDGSLNRIAAMSAVDTMIVTTGASRATEISFLSEEARAICSLFEGKNNHRGMAPATVELQNRSGATVAKLPLRSLFDADDARMVVEAMTGSASNIAVPNMVSLQALEYLSMRFGAMEHADRTIILGDPTIMLLAGEPGATLRWLTAASAHGLAVGYRHAIRVAAMTINPFYPLQHEHAFAPAYVDKHRLLTSVRNAVGVPVFNINDAGAPSLLYERLL
jgi:hypothetical protein